jgi:cytochrome c biogenesis protein CcmG/thiol:disulfide interchange protein DsbE
VPSPLINKPAPTFHLPTLLGSPSYLTDKNFQGKVSLFNIWATWCITCKSEHDFLLILAKNKGITLYGLNYKDDPVQAKNWLKKKGNPYKIIAVDSSGDTGINWGVYGTPETFIIDKKGIIRYKQIGAITPDVWQNTLEPLVRKLQAEK